MVCGLGPPKLLQLDCAWFTAPATRVLLLACAAAVVTLAARCLLRLQFE